MPVVYLYILFRSLFVPRLASFVLFLHSPTSIKLLPRHFSIPSLLLLAIRAPLHILQLPSPFFFSLLVKSTSPDME
ncbi:hypothetical protein K457DRAFT_750136 [Linnemannia elongata AG-77]|uniref:Uncharacterized protein n=1 Tax=Linnemannia elongata AG-77 TaxID=1314771 RepID=A0A197JKN7_9FUNG|nr:hypothetical protein K457DRAFT_750136 [Linnemannia elongata AG-77]